MNLKKKILFLEEKIKSQIKDDNVVVFTGFSESDFEEKRKEYLEIHPEPGLFVYIRKFTNSDFMA